MSKNGLHLITPTSIAHTGTSATINANGSVSFTDCQTVNLNGVFTADYDNYQVVMWTDSNASSGTLKFRMRLSGTDNTTASSYATQYIAVSTSSVSGFRQTTSQAELTQYGHDTCGLVAFFYGPFLAQPTAVRTVTQGADGAISTPTIYDCAVTHNQSTAYDGFSFYTGTGLALLTGRVAVYGMRK